MPPDPALRAMLAEAQAILAQGPHPDRARRDAEFLLQFVCERSDPERNRAWLLSHLDSRLGLGIAEEFRRLVQSRLAGEPIQYIVGEAEFYGLPFFVTSDVLIPRPETEHLVEKALQIAARFKKPRILDVGTGSGAIAVALATHLAGPFVSASDISAAALDLARRNAERSGVGERIRFLAGDLLASTEDERFEIIVSNPPYVPETDRNSLAVEVREYEPVLALFAGADGLAVFRRLIPAVFSALVPGGYLVLEIGHDQQEAVRGLLDSSQFHAIEFIPDLQAIPRVVVAQRP